MNLRELSLSIVDELFTDEAGLFVKDWLQHLWLEIKDSSILNK